MTTADYGDSKKDVMVTDRLADAKAQGQAQFESIKDMVDALRGAIADQEASPYTLSDAHIEGSAPDDSR